MKRHRGIRRERSVAASLIYEVLLSGALLILLAFIAAIILSAMQDPTANVKLISLATLLICAAISGFFISRHNRSTLSSIAVSLIFVAIMLAISIIVKKGNVSGALFMNYICYMLVAAFSAFLGKKRERRRRR